MFSKFKERVGNVVFVFLLILAFMITSMIIEFDYVDLFYTIIVLFYLIKYLKLKLS